MIDRSNEIIKHLDRLANDRSLPPRTRHRIREAALHIKDLHNGMEPILEQTVELELEEFCEKQ